MTRVSMKDGNAHGSMEVALLFRLIITPNPSDLANAWSEGTSHSTQASMT
eukprot:CAMPEP_0113925422 /NCGR_PEP_ID=MMETSP1159-20121227/3191_1 /TAXON_ID=88271 /ORGANISM="Picocystis salinarum" /LENGTH=49 /DNA_ID=CAMNT_0000925703 /DNA_START=319 /DNA_END=468 /DNA_ORIENTATION=+ /assembly_acc=CAM_ASM_000767